MYEKILAINRAYETPIGDVVGLQKAIRSAFSTDLKSLWGKVPNIDQASKFDRYFHHGLLAQALWDPILDCGAKIEQEGGPQALIWDGNEYRKALLPNFEPENPEGSILTFRDSVSSEIGNIFVDRMIGLALQGNPGLAVPSKELTEYLKGQDVFYYLNSNMGGAAEGSYYIAFGVAGAVDRLVHPSVLEDGLNQSLGHISKLVMLNLFPMKVVDSFVVRQRVNPFSQEGFEVVLRDDLLDCVEDLGREVFNNPLFAGSRADDPAVFEAVSKRILPIWGREVDIDQLTTSFRQQREVAFSNLGVKKEGSEPLEVLDEVLKFRQVVAAVTSQLIETDPVKEKLMRTSLQIMQVYDRFKSWEGEREVLSCPARGAGLLTAWHKFWSQLYRDWYQSEYGRLTNLAVSQPG